MKRVHAIAFIGLALFCLSVIIGVVPGASSLLPVAVVVGLLGNDYFLVGTFALVAFVFALYVGVVVRQEQTKPRTDLLTPESVPSGPYPGAEFDRFVDAHPLIARRRYRPPDVRERLRSTAIKTVQRVSHVQSEEAREQVDAGTWTDDPEVAAFLAEDSATPRRSRTEYVSALLRGQTLDQRRARRAAVAIASYSEEGEDE